MHKMMDHHGYSENHFNRGSGNMRYPVVYCGQSEAGTNTTIQKDLESVVQP